MRLVKRSTRFSTSSVAEGFSISRPEGRWYLEWVTVEDSHLADRAARAQKIIAAPGNFKVCEGCESIVTARVTECPNCHGYRFDESPERVVEQAQLLASRPQQSVTAQDFE
jgi:hypothetical protein